MSLEHQNTETEWISFDEHDGVNRGERELSIPATAPVTTVLRAKTSRYDRTRCV